jgi:hypothetical protein
MLKLIKHYPVNWVDGMKLNRDHLLKSEQASIDALRDATNMWINSSNFGLLPTLPGLNRSLDYTIDIDRTGLLRVKLKTCRAVTPSGARIEVINIDGQKLHASIGELVTEFNFQNHNAKLLFVVVSVNPFERAPFGEPDSAEQPPRYPFTIPQYSLDVIPQDQFTEVGPFHMPVAAIQVQTGAATVVESYIPPVTRVSCHNDLLRLYEEVDVFYSSMEIHVGNILQKIYSKKQTNSLAKTAEYLGERMISYLGQHIVTFRWTESELPPVHMFCGIAGFARIIKNALEMLSGSGREEFLNYLTDWDEFNLQQGEFESILNDLVLMRYNHLDIAGSVSKSKKFISTLLQVFSKLAKLDYIGKKEDPGIIVAQRSAKEVEKKSGGSRGGSIWLE